MNEAWEMFYVENFLDVVEGHEWIFRAGQVSALEQAATQIRHEAHAANGKVPERYFSGLMDAATYLTKRAKELRQTPDE